MRPVLHACLVLLLSLTTAQCGNEGLVVHVEGVKPEVASLRVRMLRADQSLVSEKIVTRTLNQFVITNVESGDYTLQLAGFGTEQCILAAGSAPVGYKSGTLRPTDVTVVLAEQTPQLCEVTVKVAAGLTVKSMPSGLDCAGGDAGKACKADFSRGSTVALSAAHSTPYRKFPNWTTGCSGPGQCSLSIKGRTDAEVVAAPRLCNGDGWCWMNPLPQGNTLRAIWGTSANDVWAVGDAGTILHYDGATWVSILSGVNDDLYAICGISKDDIWAFGKAGINIHYNGSQWQAITMPFGGDLYGCSFDRKGHGMATNYSGYVYEFTSSSWVSLNRPHSEGRPIRAIWTNQKGNGTLFDDNGRGAEWSGSQWSASGVQLGFSVNAIVGWQDSPVLAVGAGAAQFKDKKWTTQSLPKDSSTLNAVWMSDATLAWGVGNNGTIVGWNNGVWSNSISPTKMPLYGVWGATADDVWAVGERGTLLHWNGQRWSSQWNDVADGNNMNAVWGANASDVRFVGDKGTILHWDSSQIQKEESGTTGSLYDIHGSSANDVCIVGEKGLVLRWQGQQWGGIISNYSEPLNSVLLDGPGSGWLGGYSKLLRVDDGKVNRSADAATPNSGYVLALWRAFGSTWASVYSPDRILSLQSGIWKAVTLPMMFPAIDIGDAWFDNADAVWMANRNSEAGVIKYDRAGTWTVAMDAKTGANYCSAIWGRSPRDIWVACNAGMLHFNGSAWSPAVRSNYPSVRAMWGTNGGIWAAGSSGAVLYQEPPK